MTQRCIDKGKKGKTSIEVLMEQHKDVLAFIEPQSMNFDAKISDVLADFLTREEKSSKNINKLK